MAAGMLPRFILFRSFAVLNEASELGCGWMQPYLRRFAESGEAITVIKDSATQAEVINKYPKITSGQKVSGKSWMEGD